MKKLSPSGMGSGRAPEEGSAFMMQSWGRSGLLGLLGLFKGLFGVVVRARRGKLVVNGSASGACLRDLRL